eukprot:CAMPEP_0194048686 /NCGR_PEP_ID=MMETSP0009_2-20130614/28123_1 /TAXON_ID=210454 /ORGANISM="Grammatophora oceanica, Strain CCMP 410" /LENGTH=297 /DNA_ID=CAMNT_0038694623 /DNA_START=309 /DNA_END=1202 /DNA_ORIENTATION=+
MTFGKCVWVKVPAEDNDDDDGNSYFYNGRYYAQYQAYASVFLCPSNGKCGEGYCDEEIEYVTDLDQFLETQVDYVQNYCQVCQNDCRRKLEDEQEEDDEDEDEDVQDMQVDCNGDCKSICGNNNGGADETYYLECQEAYADEDGIQYYSGPACQDGDIVIGLFYDEDCTVKSALEYQDAGLGYNTFGAIQSMCQDCSDGYCDDIYQDSVHCQDGTTLAGGGDDMPVCKTYLQKKSQTYDGKRKKNWDIGGVVIGVLVLSVAFCAGSYTYYIRHRNKKDASDDKAQPLAASQNLPAVS